MIQGSEQKVNSLWLELVGLIIISLLLAGAHARYFPMISRSAPPPPDPEADRTLREVLPISMDQAELLRQSGAVFLDMRPDEEYKAERIPGAVQAGSAVPADLRGLAVVIYGHPGDMEAGAALGRRLMADGVNPVYVFIDGLEGWKAMDLPVETGGRP